jgi:transposase
VYAALPYLWVASTPYNIGMETSKNPPLDPLGEVRIAPTIAALPKADVHLHQEWSPRLDRVLARREGRPAYDWRGWASELMAETPPGMPRLKKIWADAAYRGKELAEWCQQQGDGWDLEVVEREPGTRGFNVQPRRWLVERGFAWLIRN